MTQLTPDYQLAWDRIIQDIKNEFNPPTTVEIKRSEWRRRTILAMARYVEQQNVELQQLREFVTAFDKWQWAQPGRQMAIANGEMLARRARIKI